MRGGGDGPRCRAAAHRNGCAIILNVSMNDPFSVWSAFLITLVGLPLQSSHDQWTIRHSEVKQMQLHDKGPQDRNLEEVVIMCACERKKEMN